MAYTLSPTSDPRVRGSSHIDFKTATTGISAKAMRNDISHLVGTVEDPVTKKVHIRFVNTYILKIYIYVYNFQAFDTEMQSFFYLFTRYLSERAKSQDL
jgi:UTP--glucose-1-phosphate uridylyltransferase